MNLRKGKTKTLLQSSIDSALLAVEVYNKPRTSFRSEAFITLMIIAWTRLFHAYFNTAIGDKFYYKKKNSNRYMIKDGERRAWELKTCIKKYGNLSQAVKENLIFFIGLRNKIEHRHIDKREIDVKLIQIPKISNTNRADLAVEFVKWDELSDDDRDAYEKITAIVKDRKVKVEAANVGRLKPGGVVSTVLEMYPASNLNMYTHTALVKLFEIRPYDEDEDPFETDARYCQYDEVHNDYVYTEQWVEFLVDLFQSGRISKEIINDAFKDEEQWEVSDFLTQQNIAVDP